MAQLALRFLFWDKICSAFGHIVAPSLIVLWSLAVEEQFYLVWPFVVLFTSERTLAYVATAGLFIAPLLRAIAAPYFHTAWPIQYLTPSRMDLLCAGALLAVVARRDSGAIPRLVKPAYLGLIVGVVVFVGLFLAFPRMRDSHSPAVIAGCYSALVLSCASVLVIAVDGRGIVGKVLRNPVLVYIGTISYTIYLIHMTALQVLLNHHVRRIATIGLGFAITIAFASLSWFVLERPLIGGGRRKFRQEFPADAIPDVSPGDAA